MKNNKYFLIITGIIILTIGIFAYYFFPEKGGGALEEGEFDVYFFWSSTCPHCALEKDFLQGLREKYPDVEIKDYDFSKSISLIKDFYEKYEVPKDKQGFIPATFIKDKYYIGFNEKTGQEIENYIAKLLQESPLEDNFYLDGDIESNLQRAIKIPFLGEINLVDFSLPVLAIILGTVDGFNICSLGALVLILGLILVFKSRIKILILGLIFIFSAVLSYGILIFLWHRFFVVLGPYIKRMEILIGSLALFGAVYLFNEFLKYFRSGPVCNYSGIAQKLNPRIQKIFSQEGVGIFALIGAVILFSAVITVVEFPCSAFFPVMFTGIMAAAKTPLVSSFLYMAIYMFFYMIDEIIILLIAVATFKIWIASPKFITVFNLVGSIIFLFLGIYYLFS